MKTNATITELSHEDLVDLLSTASFGSAWLSCQTGELSRVEIKSGDSREDVWAKALLAGHKIKCYDYYAEGEVYGTNGKVLKDDVAVYFIGLDDIKRGLEKARSGDFTGSENDKRWAAECYNYFLHERYSLDLPAAECLMQIIMFNEVVYG